MLAEWEAADRVVAPVETEPRRRVKRPESARVAEEVLRYFKHVRARRSRDDGRLTNYGVVVRPGLRVLREEAGDGQAIGFGPQALRQVRDALVKSDRFNRKPFNENTRTIVAAFG